jgi:hypothetical protein
MRLNYQLFFIIIILPVLILDSCGYSRRQNWNGREEMPELGGSGKNSKNFPPPVQSYRLWHTYDQFDLRTFKFYGGFFDDRLKFFYNTNPGLRMVDADVDLIMLYFLDERLVKIRYHLSKDVTGAILDSLGMGFLETRYNRRKKVMATGSSIRKLREYNLQKGKKDKFDIVWDRQIIESSYHVDPNPSSLYTFDTVRANFVYVDQLKSYRKSLIRLENELKQKVLLSAEK